VTSNDRCGRARHQAAALAVSTVLAGALAVQAAGRTVWDGVYTAPQAERGKALFAERCSRCHGDFLDGDGAGERGVALAGTSFEENWESASLNDLFAKIARTMPPGAAGTLSSRETLDVMAFLLQFNGYPAGANELSDTWELTAIDIVGRDGPRPLRIGAGVRSVGCLARDADGGWALVHASTPVRTRTALASAGRDVDRARAAPLGVETIRLDGPAAAGDRVAGAKVEVKGVLSTVGPLGITVTSLQTVGAACP
jgi:S-disulfanyl-L-cysteine oxidoreductase SoxD